MTSENLKITLFLIGVRKSTMSDSYGPLLRRDHLPTSQGPGYASYHSDNPEQFIFLPVNLWLGSYAVKSF